MSKRGPKFKPQITLQKRGSRRTYDRKNEPSGKGDVPVKPRWLPKEAWSDWKRVTGILERRGLIANCEAEMIARYCLVLVAYRKNVKIWVKDGYKATMVIKDEKGKKKCTQTSVIMAAVNKLEDKLRRMEAEFGLTPSARAGISKGDNGGNENNEGKKDKSRFFPNWAQRGAAG